MKVIGLMSGTSLDGIDAVLVDIAKDASGQPSFELIGFESYPYETNLKRRIADACDDASSHSALISSLNFELGEVFSQAVTRLLNTLNVDGDAIDLIASHGQTIYHIPRDIKDYKASTLQIGEPAIIAYQHNTDVISDFRVMDMAASGEGAPIVPYLDYALFKTSKEGVVLQNIGGIGNLTFIPGNGKASDIIAYDTGPGNMLIDGAMKMLFNEEFDASGEVARKGTIHHAMMDHLKNHPYLEIIPPKTTGREMFGENYLKELLVMFSAVKREDVIATLTAFTAYSIAFHVKRDIMQNHSLQRMIVSGGGAHNKTLIDMIEEALGMPVEVFDKRTFGFGADEKEAVAIAYMGYETYHGIPSNVMSATGAKESVVLGKITPKPRKKK